MPVAPIDLQKENWRKTTYVKSDVNLAKDDCKQSYGNHGGRRNANKHTNHKNRLFHPDAPLQVFVTQPIVPLWREFLKDHFTNPLLGA